MAPSQIVGGRRSREPRRHHRRGFWLAQPRDHPRSEEHTSELQSQSNLVCRLLLEKKKLNSKVTVAQVSINACPADPFHSDSSPGTMEYEPYSERFYFRIRCADAIPVYRADSLRYL